MKNLIEQVKDKNALEVASTIESILKQKTREVLDETRKQVAANSFGITSFETNLDESVELNEVLIPGKKLSPDQHKKVLSAFIHRHTGEHTPNWVRTSDDHHTPTHTTDKDWVHDHAFHFNKKTGNLSDNRKYAEPHYVADNVKEALNASSLWKSLGGKKAAGKKPVTAKDLMPSSEYQKNLDTWRKHDRGAKPVKEAQQQHHAISKPAHSDDVASPEEVAKHDAWAKQIRAKSASGQSEFNKKWHAAKTPDERKALKKHAFQNDYDLPWSGSTVKSKSPIHSFAAEETMNEAIAYPATSKHLKDYKKTDTKGVFHHPDGHRIEVDKDQGEIHHYTAGSSKPKTFKNAGDLHTHLMKLHHDFDDKVKQHTIDHIHDNGYGLLHKMGKLDYAHKNHPEGRDHEEDAVNYKAMHKAVMGFQAKDRKASRAAYDAANKK